MFRTCLSAALVLTVTSFIAFAGQNAAPNKKDQNKKDKGQQGQQATITKMDAKNHTVTVKMKDKNGKEVEKMFKLTEDIRYFDSTGKAAVIDVFRSGDQILVLEAEGNLKQVRHQGNAGSASKDRDFVHLAAEIDMAEVRLGKLAQERASAAAIKKFAERLVSDHARMNKELRELAKSEGVQMPDKLDKEHQDLWNQLSKLKGMEFDREFAKDMVHGHEKAVMKFEDEAKNGRDPQVKAWAAKWAPTLREHLDLARSALKEVKSSK